MAETVHRKTFRPRENLGFRQGWCFPFGLNHPRNVENLSNSQSKTPQKSTNSFPNSPQTNRTPLGLVGRNRIDPRRILSPGRVSPIDSDTPFDNLPEIVQEPSSVVEIGDKVGSMTKQKSSTHEGIKNEAFSGVFDVRLSLKGKNGGCLVLELYSEVLSANSSVFANLIENCRRNSGNSTNLCRIEVPDVDNLNVFHETIELMFEEDDIMKCLFTMGVSRSIDVLEVAAGIMFTKGVLSCLKYLEAVPWSEGEEEKLKSLFRRISFDDTTTRDVLARLYSPEQINSQQHLAMQLVRSVTNGTNNNSRSELKSLVKGIVSKTSTYEKDLGSLNKSELYDVCQSCLGSLIELFEEASDSIPDERLTRVESSKPLIVRISRQVDNIVWLFEILLDQQMAEEFVDVWADQCDLLRMHERTSQMVRYELSRISVSIFIALGTGKLQCRSEARCGVLQAWFMPMLVDFGWLQRCRKGLDIKVFEEATGQALLTLPMKHQQLLFMEWIRYFSRQGTTECPNLSKAFQTWWRRRSFFKGCEASALDSRECLKNSKHRLVDVAVPLMKVLTW